MAAMSPIVATAAVQVPVTPEPAPLRPLVPALRVLEPAPQSEAANVLSPTQVRTFLDCSAKWWFRYGLRLPEPKTSSLTLGTAVHEALAENFRQKIETKEDLPVAGVLAVFRDRLDQELTDIDLAEDEDTADLKACGELLVRTYMDQAAPVVEPAAVELRVTGEIGGVQCRGTSTSSTLTAT